MINDTVAAVSTAKGKGGVAMIRISGFDALAVAQKIFAPHSKSDEIIPRKCYYGNILRENQIIDDGIMTYFKAPHSYTGEDVCEICCHGGIYVTSAVLEAALSSGARLAAAGEFTKRAYINGNLSLSRAEAVGYIIDAKTDYQLKLSSAQARGVLSDKLLSVRDLLLGLIAHAYAAIDYPDEDLPDLERHKMGDKLDTIISCLEKLASSYHAGRAICEGIKTAVIGKANSGKSSLFNLISGQDLSIVTDIAGTTRDVIEYTVSLGGVTLSLADTAGIRDSFDEVEKIGIERASRKIQDSELLFCVFDTSTKETEQDDFILGCAKNKSAVAILNKIDKKRRLSSEFEKRINEAFKYSVSLSAKTGEGLDCLEKVVSQMFSLSEIDILNDAVILNARQFSSIRLALDEAQNAKDALLSGQTNDIVCFSLERALAELEGIDQRGAGEEIVNEIFSHFCVGK